MIGTNENGDKHYLVQKSDIMYCKYQYFDGIFHYYDDFLETYENFNYLFVFSTTV